MKNICKIAGMLLAAMVLSACSDNIDKPDSWPEWPTPSKPVIESITVTPADASGQKEIVAGGRIKFSAVISDEYNDLVSAELTINLNNKEIYKETFPLQGLQAEINKEIRIPFMPGLSDGTMPKVLLTAKNKKQGSTEAEPAEENNIRINRPADFGKLFLIDATKKIVELFPNPEESLKFETVEPISGLSPSFRIAEKITAGQEADYSGFVWGMKEGEIAIIESEEDAPITIGLADGGALKSITFDTFSFSVSYLLSNYINGVEMGASSYPNFMEVKLDLEEGQEILFEGFANLENIIQPDFFRFISDNKTKFKGLTGNYTLLYSQANGFIYVERKEAVYPDAMWICGTGMGFTQSPYQVTGRWMWEWPTDYVFCRKVADNVFEATMYLDNFMFKFFRIRGWGEANEERAENYTLKPEGLIIPGRNEWNDLTGDCVAGPEFVAGVYKIRIDMGRMEIELIPSTSHQ